VRFWCGGGVRGCFGKVVVHYVMNFVWCCGFVKIEGSFSRVMDRRVVCIFGVLILILLFLSFF